MSIDDYAATRSAIEHLIALGHRHIAFVGSAPTETNMRYSAEARLQGVIDAAAAHPGEENCVMHWNRFPSHPRKRKRLN